MNYRSILFFALTMTIAAACGDKDESSKEGNPKQNGTVVESQKTNFVVDTLSTALKNPWGIAILPDGRILVTERAGEILIFKDGELTSEKITGVPEVFAVGQGGLLDIKLHPDYATNGWIYLSYAKPGKGGAATTIARAKLEGTTLTNLQEIFSAQPFVDSGLHFGSRIAFDNKGYIFFSCGERGTMENAQKLENHLGKIIRLHDDGKVPTDNPFVNTSGAKPEIWSYGHRNPQGLVYNFDTETLWDHEHGPKGGDELNKIQKGKNYGWPTVTYGINYDGKPISDKTSAEGIEEPVTYWVPSIAPCGMTVVTGKKFTSWKNNLLIGALSFQHVARVEMDGDKYVAQEKLLDQVARVRAVAESPEGDIYVATEGPGMLLRLTPAE